MEDDHKNGGIHAMFVIIDDGWQSVGMDPNGTEWKHDCAAKWVDFHPTIIVHNFFTVEYAKLILLISF